MRILHALHRFAESGTGDVKALQGDIEELRLRVADYRLFFVCPVTTSLRFAACAIAGRPTANAAWRPATRRIMVRSRAVLFPLIRRYWLDLPHSQVVAVRHRTVDNCVQKSGLGPFAHRCPKDLGAAFKEQTTNLEAATGWKGYDSL